LNSPTLSFFFFGGANGSASFHYFPLTRLAKAGMSRPLEHPPFRTVSLFARSFRQRLRAYYFFLPPDFLRSLLTPADGEGRDSPTGESLGSFSLPTNNFFYASVRSPFVDCFFIQPTNSVIFHVHVKKVVPSLSAGAESFLPSPRPAPRQKPVSPLRRLRAWSTVPRRSAGFAGLAFSSHYS